MTEATRPATRRSTVDTWKALADQGLYSATSFATTLLVARNTSVPELGWFSGGVSLLITVVGFMSSFVAIPLMISLQGADDADRDAAVEGGLGASIAMAGTVAAAMLIAVAVLLAWRGSGAPIAGWLMVLAGVVIPFVVREFARQMAFARLGLPGLALMDVTYSIVALGGLTILARAGATDANRGLAMVGAAALASVLAWWLTTRPSISWSAIGSAPGFLRSHLQMSRWLCGTSILYACSISAIPWLLGLLSTSTSVGQFAASATIAGVLNPLLLVGGNLTAPRAARAAIEPSRRAVRRVALIASTSVGIGMAVVAVGLALGESTLLPLLFGPSFRPAPLVLWLLVGSAVSEAFGIGAFWGLHSVGESRLAFWARAASVAIAIPFGIWGILRLGALGAAWLMLALRALNAVFNWILFVGVSRSPERLTAHRSTNQPVLDLDPDQLR